MSLLGDKVGKYFEKRLFSYRVLDYIIKCHWIERETSFQYYLQAYPCTCYASFLYGLRAPILIMSLLIDRPGKYFEKRLFSYRVLDYIIKCHWIERETSFQYYLQAYLCTCYASFLYGLRAPILIMCLFSETKQENISKSDFSHTECSIIS